MLGQDKLMKLYWLIIQNSKISKYQLDIDKHKTISTVHTFEELKLEARGTIFLILNLILSGCSINDMILTMTAAGPDSQCRVLAPPGLGLTPQWSTRDMRPSKILPVVIHRLFGTSLKSKHAQPSDYTNTNSHIFG